MNKAVGGEWVNELNKAGGGGGRETWDGEGYGVKLKGADGREARK